MPEQEELQRKTGQRGLLITSYRGSEKDSDRAVTPAVEAVCVPAHGATRVPTSQAAAPPSRSTLTGQSCHRQKSCLCAQGHFGCVRLCDPVDCGLPGFSVRDGVLQARLLECIGQYWLPYLLEHCISYYPTCQPP